MKQILNEIIEFNGGHIECNSVLEKITMRFNDQPSRQIKKRLRDCEFHYSEIMDGWETRGTPQKLKQAIKITKYKEFN